MDLSVFIDWPYSEPMRDWQERCARDFKAVRLLKQDYLVVACPGAGKTKVTLKMVVDLIIAGLVQRVVIVCPTEEVCRQWQKAAKRFGIELLRAGAETKEFHGVIVTYAQLVNGWMTHRTLCREKTVVVLDEIHHCADGLAWGEMIRQAFEAAEYRIALSGTPFRSDNHAIPFVTYADGVCQPDFVYSYQNALDDPKVCRLAFFPTIDGSAEWLVNGQRKSARLEEKLSDSDASDRLRTILDPHGEWIATTIAAADEKTEHCRYLGHKDAGELWLCLDQDHAEAIANVIHRKTGERPVVVISKDPKAPAKIEAFRKGNQKRLVSVRMVCEGADIPRLRVLVYATNIITEMFLRQALGRIIRWLDGLDEQAVFMFVPRLLPFIEFALQVIEERTHHIRQDQRSEERETTESRGQRALFLPDLFQPLASQGMVSNVIGEGMEFSQEAIIQARAVMQYIQSPLQVEEMTKALIQAGLIHAGRCGLPRPETAQDYEKPLDERKTDLRQRIYRCVNRWAYLDSVEPGVIHAEWIRHSGTPTKNATLEDLQAKWDWVVEGLAEAQRRQGGGA